MKRFFAAFALCLIGSGAIFAANAKLSPDLQSADPHSNIRVIVQYAPALPNSSLLAEC